MTEPMKLTIYKDQKSDRISIFGFLRKTINDIVQFRFAFRNFVFNGIRVRYRRSKIGFLWTLLNPLLTMAVISIAFSYVFEQDIKEFSIFLFSGLTPYNFMSSSITSSTTSLVTAENFLKKMYIPKIIFPFISVSIEAVNFFLSVSALYILALILGAKLSITLLLLPFSFLLMFLFTIGVGLLLSVLYVYFRDISHFVQVGLTALFYITPILYPENFIPAELKSIFLLNPFTYYVSLIRKCILGSPMTIIDWLIPFGISIFLFIFSLIVLKIVEKRIIFRL